VNAGVTGWLALRGGGTGRRRRSPSCGFPALLSLRVLIVSVSRGRTFSICLAWLHAARKLAAVFLHPLSDVLSQYLYAILGPFTSPRATECVYISFHDCKLRSVEFELSCRDVKHSNTFIMYQSTVSIDKHEHSQVTQ